MPGINIPNTFDGDKTFDGQLDVSGIIQATANSTALVINPESNALGTSLSCGQNLNLIFDSNGVGSDVLRIMSGTGSAGTATAHLNVDTSGFVGIGEPSPDGKLHITHDGSTPNTTLTLESEDTTFDSSNPNDVVSSIAFKSRDPSYPHADDVAGLIQLVPASTTGGSYDLRLSSGGTTSAPGEKTRGLHINNNGGIFAASFNTGATTTGSFYSYKTNALGTGDTILRLRYAGAPTIAAARYIIFGNQSDFDAGSIAANGVNDVQYNTSSDGRLKDNQRPSDYGLNEVLNLDAKRFEWKSDGLSSVGFIAQEVYQIMPEFVTPPDNPDDKWMMDYKKLVPVLWQAVRELKDEVDKLKST